VLQTEEGLHISGRVHHREVKLCRKLPRGRQERHARHLVEPPHQQAFEPEAALEL